MLVFAVLSDLPAVTLVAIFLIAILAGIVKGAIGFAMPLVMISGIGSLIDPKLALAGIILPILMSNGLQTFRKGVGEAARAAREFWRYLAMVCVAIFLAAQAVPFIPGQTFYLVLGIPVLALAAVQLAGLRLTIPVPWRPLAEWVAGILSGILGGLSGTWGPTTVLYLLAIDTPKSRQIVIQGVIYGLGSVTLLFAHIQSGILNAQTAPFSVALLPSALLGMWIGFQIQDRLDQELFRKITLIVLMIGALNLVRRGLIG
ncbi:MAG: sulfite exporter TauE/SafE family protein [Pseudomonadota bacterium]